MYTINVGQHYIYPNNPPQAQGGVLETNLSLDTRSQKCPGGCDFVKMFAS
jgi:hypothetical protein